MNIKPIETVYNGYRFRSRLEARWAVFFDAVGIKYEYEKEGFDLGKYGYYLPDFWLPELNLYAEIKPSQNDEDVLTKRKCQALVEGLSSGMLLMEGSPSVRCGSYHITVFLADYIVNCSHGSLNGIDVGLFVDFPGCLREEFYSLSCELYGFIYRRYQEHPNYFSSPLPSRGDAKKIIEADKVYFQKHYGKKHPHWEFGICEGNYIITHFSHRKLRLSRTFYDYDYDEFLFFTHPNVKNAFDAAQQARFEHGEKGYSH